MLKAVVFDIDGTLAEHNAWLALTRDMGGSEKDHLAIYSGHIGGIISYDDAKAQMLDVWLKTGRATKSHIEKIYNDWSLRQEAYGLVDWLKDQGYKVCLITGSVYTYAAVVADKLGIADYYANADFIFDKSGRLKDFNYDADQATVKLAHFWEFCQKHGLQPSECITVGDGENDIGLFKSTGRGILVDNSEVSGQLRSAAWKVVGSLADVRKVVTAEN